MADPAPDLKARIAVRARTLGFEACGFADVSGEWSEGEGLAAFLQRREPHFGPPEAAPARPEATLR